MEELRCLLDIPGLWVSYDEANGWLYNQLAAFGGVGRR
jgi:hypothetical protein